MADERKTYRILTGGHRRFEGGRLVSYTAGDVVVLDERESRRMRYRIEPVGVADQLPSGRVEFTAPESDNLTVAELKTVIADLDASRVRDVWSRERAGKNRVTVFRALEARARVLNEDASADEGREE